MNQRFVDEGPPVEILHWPEALVAASRSRRVMGPPVAQLILWEDVAELAMRRALQQVMDQVADRISHTLTAALVAHLPGKHDQSTHGHGGSSVRGALAGASTTQELNVAAMAEMKRITGRDIPVDMAGQDLQLAKENLEGIAQGLERFPDASLVGVYSYGPGAAKTNMGGEIARLHSDASAVTQAHGVMEDGKVVVKSNVYFNNRYSKDPAGYRAAKLETHDTGYLVTGTPTGTALHEFGHVVVNQTSSKRAAYDAAVDLADKAGATPRTFITRHVSGYASEDMGEFAAEAFADVMTNGSSASLVSKAAFDVIESAYKGMT